MGLKIAIMQPYLFPYIGYWQLINCVDTFVVYDDVNYIKGGWINRNRILLNENPILLTFPLSGASSFKLIKDIQMSSNIKARIDILKTVQQAYNKAPYFKLIYPLLEKIILFEERDLTRFILNSLIELSRFFNINTKFVLSSVIDNDKSLNARERLIEICKKFGAETYINPIGGLKLYNKKDFEKHNIRLYFLRTNEIIYKQFGNDFIPSLSIIDVLMFNSVEEIRNLLENYELE